MNQKLNTMRNSIYFSAILGLIFLAIGFIGFFIELSDAKLFLFIGLGMLFVVALPLYIIESLRYQKKKASILKKYQGVHRIRRVNKIRKKQNPDYPSFRKQKSGLTWGGGNIHGSTAKRGTKREFLK